MMFSLCPTGLRDQQPHKGNQTPISGSKIGSNIICKMTYSLSCGCCLLWVQRDSHSFKTHLYC